MLNVLAVLSNELTKLQWILVVKLDMFTINLNVFKLLVLLVTVHYKTVCL